MSTSVNSKITPYTSVNYERITPNEQYRRLHQPILEKVLAASILIPQLSCTVAEYATDSNWYNALNAMNLVPRTIPSLRIDGEEIPIPGSYYLIPPQKLGEIAEQVNAHLERNIGKLKYENSYKIGLDEVENFFKLRNDPLSVFAQDADLASTDYQWVWISNEVLEGSRNQPCAKQFQMVADLRATVPTMRELLSVVLLHQVATGALLPQRTVYTRVQEAVNVEIDPYSRVRIVNGYEEGNPRIGVMALKNL